MSQPRNEMELWFFNLLIRVLLLVPSWALERFYFYRLSNWQKVAKSCMTLRRLWQLGLASVRYWLLPLTVAFTKCNSLTGKPRSFALSSTGNLWSWLQLVQEDEWTKKWMNANKASSSEPAVSGDELNLLDGSLGTSWLLGRFFIWHFFFLLLDQLITFQSIDLS